MKVFTNSRRAFQSNEHQSTGGFFIRVILYVCIFCLLNTLFFSIIKSTSPLPQHLHSKTGFYHQNGAQNANATSRITKIKVAKSLLRFVLETVLAADTKDTQGPPENRHEELHRMDYLPQFYVCLIRVPFKGKLSSPPYTQPLLNRPFLDMLTPPPKA